MIEYDAKRLSQYVTLFLYKNIFTVKVYFTYEKDVIKYLYKHIGGLYGYIRRIEKEGCG